MLAHGALVEREEERAALDRAIQAARDGRGGLVLVSGEAGVGKTALVSTVLAESGLLLLPAASSHEPSEPYYGPIVAVLRAFARSVPGGLDGSEPLAVALRVLLPELGPVPASPDRAMLAEAIRRGFERIAAHGPALAFLDDLQWADAATLDLLSAMAGWLDRLPLLVIGAYRGEEVPPGHPLRRARLELRRAGWSHEIVVRPLTREGTARLAGSVLGHAPSPSLVAIMHERTRGLPFFVEELAAALAAGSRLHTTGDGLALDPHDPLPVPESVRDAVLLRARDVGDAARAALEVAAVAGVRFDLALIADLAGGEAGLDALIDRQILVEAEPGVGAFRHALARDALYGEISWGSRRALHRQIAERLEARLAPPSSIAEHWSAAEEPVRARRAWIAAAEAAAAVHAYRDAARAAERALALWPHDGSVDRLDLLERLGHCTELAGEPAEAARVWREAADGWRAADDRSRAATAERRLAAVHEMLGAWEQAIAARLSAADAFRAAGLPGEAATERLAVASHLISSSSYSATLPLLAAVRAEADEADRLDLTVRAMGLEGSLRVRLGQHEAGLTLVRDGLALALGRNLSRAAAEVYYRLGDALDHAGQLVQAREAYLGAADLCRAGDDAAMAQICLACMSVVLWQIGQWDKTIEVCRDVLASEDGSQYSRMAATGMLGSVYGFRGAASRARPLLLQAATLARLIERTPMEIICAWGFAFLECVGGNHEGAAGHCRSLLARWERSEERHYSISPLRWATTFFAVQGAAAEARACASALSRIAADTGSQEALAGLAHALGETLLLEGDAEQAGRQFEHALVRLRELPLPFDTAQTRLRAGVALSQTGRRTPAVEHLAEAYRTARRLGARPLAAEAACKLRALGVSPEEQAGRQAGTSPRAGLSARQLEVLRHVALGRTDREIAQALVLSPRTVEMHVANCLAKLDCRSRAAAIRRASELGLLDG